MKLSGQMAGRFRLVAFKKDAKGEIVPSSQRVAADWFNNLILDQGLEFLGHNTSHALRHMMGYCHIGSGNSTPSSGQSNLDSRLAVSDDDVDTDTGAVNGDTPYVWRRVVIEFAPGAGTGNISEVGMGWGSDTSDLFSRALILDTDGNPTSITKLSDEYLQVTYELRLYPPTTDAADTITLDGITYDVTMRAADVGSYGGSYTGWSLELGSTSSGNNSSSYRGYDGNIGDYTGAPGGSYDSSSTPTIEDYVDNSYTQYKTIKFDLDEGNFSNGIRSVLLQQGWGRWQLEFSAQGTGDAINKTSSKTLSLTIGHTWGRASI
ncbi:hypothetical protein ACJJIE_02635 [Microbulbifer sp. TRSA001]|uniref:hypothetical protein n=1 Tax=Microbulbifer sp. TRSA001 TaxID=3243381 RepID=UPI004039C5A6